MPDAKRKRTTIAWPHVALAAVLLLALAGVAAVLVSGCSRDISTVYGQRKGPGVTESVNGTAVLGEMFERAGHRVSSWGSLSPRLKERADCIVWFPDDFNPPDDNVREWLEEWLMDRPGRTLVYVGRDFDAAPRYWLRILPGTPGGQLTEVRRRARTAMNAFQAERPIAPKSSECDWFTIEHDYLPRDVRSLEGDPKWGEGIDPSKLQIELNGRMAPSASAEVLLESEGDMLISSETWDESRLLVVANGSFLLNLALVNHEHRKLAGRLIETVGPPRQTVVFLESYRGGPPIHEGEPWSGIPTGMEIFQVWPTNWILLHLAALGIIFCFSRWPIFGPPRSLDPPGLADFGKHIHALGELLERSGDRGYALARIEHYRQLKDEA